MIPGTHPLPHDLLPLEGGTADDPAVLQTEVCGGAYSSSSLILDGVGPN
jgi:hypothetical protein